MTKKQPFVKYLGLYLLLAVGVVGLGWYSYSQILPYHFSPQRHNPWDSSGAYNRLSTLGNFHGELSESLLIEPGDTPPILGTSDPDVSKRIEIDLGAQKLFAVENEEKIAEFDISTGKWGRTPTGTFSIWTKFRFTRMSGGNKALGTHYDLPNVPYTMFFYNDEIPMSRGYGIHGTYWHSNYGVPMSHGCINMRTRDVEKLYYWAGPLDHGKASMRASDDNPGTEVVIYGEPPQD